MDYASRIRWNMGQMPDRYFDQPYLERIISHIHQCLASEVHNAQVNVLDPQRYPADHWRHDLVLNSRIEREYDIQQLELLLAEIELALAWELFPFQRGKT